MTSLHRAIEFPFERAGLCSRHGPRSALLAGSLLRGPANLCDVLLIALRLLAMLWDWERHKIRRVIVLRPRVIDDMVKVEARQDLLCGERLCLRVGDHRD